MSTYVLEESTFTKNSMIMLWGRNIDTKELKSFLVTDFKPYFFAPHESGEYTSCYNTPLQKIVCNTPQDLKEKMLYFDSTYDADIPLDMQFRISKGITYAFDDDLNPVNVDTHLTPKILYYDIEVHSDDEFPKPEQAKYPIVIISCYNSYDDKIKIFTTLDLPKTKPYKNEKFMLEAFARYIKKEDFDVICGWYNKNFDDIYVFNRSQKLNANIVGFSRVRQKFPWERDIFPTRSCVDLMELFKEWSKPLGLQESYGLKNIAEKFAGFTYEDHGAEIGELIHQKRYKALNEYAINDVISLARIDQVCGLINFYENLRMMTGVKLEHTLQKTRMYEYYLMHNFDYPLPTKKKHERERFKGAFVKEPVVGIHEDVASMDLAALYPNIIIGYNISPDAFDMIPTTIKKLMDKREELRAMRLRGEGGEVLKTTEQSLKYVINSAYGVMAYPTFKLFNMDCAKFVPEKGQEIIKSVINYLESENLDVIYGDTDSVYTSPIKTVEMGLDIENKINNFLAEWSDKDGSDVHFKIKFETLYRRIFFKGRNYGEQVAKKRYIGWVVWEDGFETNKLGYKGIELRRSDVAPITKTAMTEFFNKLLVDNDQKSAIKYIYDLTHSICKGDISIQELAIPRNVTEGVTSPHNRGIKNSKLILNYKLRKQRKPRLIYCKRPSPVKEICIDEDLHEFMLKNKVTIDYETIMKKTIKNKFESIFKAIGTSWEEEIDNQSLLSRWM